MTKGQTLDTDRTDRRCHKRYQKSIQALLKINEHWEKIECFDISGGGVCLDSPVRPELGKTLELHIEGFGRFEGKTIRHLANGFVIQFSSSEHTLNQLATDLDNT